MTVTVTYDFDVLNEAQNIDFGIASGEAAVTGLSNGGFVGVGDFGVNSAGSVYDPAGNPIASLPITPGTNSVIDQLSDGNLVIVSQDSVGTVFFTVVNSATGASVVPTTDIAVPAPSSNAAVVALAAGGFAVFVQSDFTSDNDINVSVFGNDGTFQTTFSLDFTVANDTDVSATQLDGGDLAFTWTRTVEGNTEVWYAICSAAGDVIKAPTQFDAQGNVNQNASISAMNGGGFALAYEDTASDDGRAVVRVAMFDAAGSSVGSRQVTQENQTEVDPALTRLANGMLALTVVRDATTFIDLIDPSNGRVLADRDVLSVLPGSNPADPVITGFGTGRIAVVYNDAVAGISGGQSFNVVRTSTVGFGGDTVIGDDFIDVINGSFSNDILNGAGNNDVIFGGGGGDRIEGGDGDDQIGGGGASDIINGGDGNDIIFASASDDPDGSSSGDIIHGNAGADTIRGSSGRDTLFGDGGNDTLDGGVDADAMIGGAGDDIYVVDDANDVVSEGIAGSNGRDTVRSTISFSLADTAHVKGAVENLTLLGTDNLNATGNGLTNLLIGNAGENILDGGLGADIMQGGAGVDRYIVDTAGDIVDESVAGSNGQDIVLSSISFNLANTAVVRGQVEIVQLLGTADLNLAGNALANRLVGNSGANQINGGLGADLMQGRGGNDIYTVDNAGDRVDESLGGSSGIDLVRSTISFNLTSQALGAVENVTLYGTTNINVTGNALANVLIGNGGANLIIGGLGNDTLTGGLGNDSFLFNTTPSSNANVDRVTDMNEQGNDTIRLDDAVFSALSTGALSAAAFHAGTAAGDGDDRIVYNRSTGELFYDADGNSAGASVRFAILDAGLTLTSADFFVV